jgi:PAS domain S-box-containing protein
MISTYDSLALPAFTYNPITLELHGNSRFQQELEPYSHELVNLIQPMWNWDSINTSQDAGLLETHHLMRINDTEYFLSLLNPLLENGAALFLIEGADKIENLIRASSFFQRMEKDYLSILESLHDDFVIVNGDGQLITVLPNFETFYGVPASEVLGKTVYEMEDLKIFNPSIAARVMRSKKTETVLQMTGSGKYLMCTAIPIKEESGNIIKVVSFSRDVTQFELLKEQHAKLQDAIQFYDQELARLKEIQEASEEIIGDSREIKTIVEMLMKASSFDATVLLTGESGVGKSMHAKFIHKHSSRSKGPFVEINCGAIPETLFESELFGYEKGAFSGASSGGKMGWIEKANSGTLFLDEVADLPFAMQVKLLKVLDNKKVSRVGSLKEIEVNFRLVAATNQNLEKLVKAGTFREDLFHRINVISIQVPPLRDRKNDILNLTSFFTKKYSEKYSREINFSSKALDALLNYKWPGNVRELENLVERLFLTVDGYVVTEKDLPATITKKEPQPIYSIENQTLPEVLASIEKEIILNSYKKHGNTTKVASELGISQPSVSVKLKKYGTTK